MTTTTTTAASGLRSRPPGAPRSAPVPSCGSSVAATRTRRATRVTAGALELLGRARTALESACHAGDASTRYLDAYLGALRAGAALVVARASALPRGRVRGVWPTLPALAPELGEWATFFAATSARRGVLERGGRVSAREADDLLRQAEMFLGLVEAALDLPPGEPLPRSTAPLVTARQEGPAHRADTDGGP